MPSSVAGARSSDTSSAGSLGLTSEEAAARLRSHGPNEITREEGISPLRIFADQFRGVMIWLLFGACVLSALLGETRDAIAIGAIMLVNATVGFFQEYRSERAVQALRSMTGPRARVLRDGHSTVLAATEIVSGDALLLEAGDIVAADARIVQAHDLETAEAALTGESVPVEKSTAPEAPDAPLAERHAHVFMGTHVVRGTGIAEVVATGMRTELGHIAGLLAATPEQDTPLEKRLEAVGNRLLVACLGIVVVVAGLGAWRHRPWLEVVMSSVSLAVAAVPEGLAAIVTVSLAIGVQRMAARNVLVRRLHAVESLGSATVICTDKTGTLTTGKMSVRELWGSDHRRVLDIAAACSDAELGEHGSSHVGDPTEVALLVAADERGIRRSDLERERPRRATHPFDADRKRMSILRADGILYVKGAVDLLLPLCTSGTDGALTANAEMASRGLRVLAVAVGSRDEESDLELVGLIGIADPPRTEVVEAVRIAREAGITTVMITGDHPVTARAIATEIGIVRPGDDVADLVHARATPEEKLRIVRDWKARGAIVAMTGDGVNDAPALREAHVGIAMGIAGTEVTREASDMILTDDDFASIVAAIREGRGIFDNIQKTLVYLLGGNTSELLVMLGASLLGLPLPLSAIQLLWINLATDGLPGLALALDPADPHVLERKPRKPDEAMLGATEWRMILLTGLVEATVTLGAFAWALRTRDVVGARNLAFSVLVFGELFRAFSARSPTRVFFDTRVFSNPTLLGVIAGSVLLQIGIHFIPMTQGAFGLRPVTLDDLQLALGLGLVPVTLIELTKLALQARRGRRNESE